MKHVRSHYGRVVLGWSILLSLSACSQEDGIRQYTVPKASSIVSSSSSAPEVDQVWFFKLTGPEDALLAELPKFSEFIRSVRFADGNPAYTLPESWQEQGSSGMRFQTISIPGSDPPLEIAISTLKAPQEKPLDYLKANIDRWRGQLGLSAMEGDDWYSKAESEGELIARQESERSLIFVNLVGAAGSRMITAIVTNNELGIVPESSGPAMAAAAPKSGLKYDTPEGWETSKGNSMRLASFAVKGEDGAADVSVTRFPGGGGLLENINRWRGQVKLEPIKEDQLTESSEEMKVGDRDATLTEIIGDEQSILAAIVPDGDMKWFFKMQGPSEIVKAEQKRFKQFLNSVSFE